MTSGPRKLLNGKPQAQQWQLLVHNVVTLLAPKSKTRQDENDEDDECLQNAFVGCK